MLKKQKQIIIGFLIGAFLFGGVPVLAASGMKTISAYYNDIKISIDGKELKTDSEPFIVDGRTYVPVRVISEALGVKVNWNDKTNTVELGEIASSSEVVSITDNGFYDGFYYVIFSDGFSILTGTKSLVLTDKESVNLVISTTGNVGNIKIPTIVGNSILGDYIKFYPMTIDEYSNIIAKKIDSSDNDGKEEAKKYFIEEYKIQDFLYNFNKFYSDKQYVGSLIFDSFPELYSISYDDGIHKCILYLYN